MGSVRLYAIAIDEVRDIFAGSEETAAELRAVAAVRFGSGTAPQRGLLDRLGPVFRRQADAPVLRPGVPSGSDVDALLGGRYVAPHRLTACWTLLETWLEHLAWGTLEHELGERLLDDVDFDLVRAEVPARYGLRALLRSDLGIALMPCPGIAAGWAPLARVQEMTAAWHPAVDRLEPAHQPLATGILDWLDRYPGWADAATAASRRPPDLVAVLRS